VRPALEAEVLEEPQARFVVGSHILQAELRSALDCLPQQQPAYAPAAVSLGDVDADLCGGVIGGFLRKSSKLNQLSTASRVRTLAIPPEAGQGLL
jgi:hypothetical protein